MPTPPWSVASARRSLVPRLERRRRRHRRSRSVPWKDPAPEDRERIERRDPDTITDRVATEERQRPVSPPLYVVSSSGLNSPRSCVSQPIDWSQSGTFDLDRSISTP